MKSIYVFFLCASLFISSSGNAQHLITGSFNIRLAASSDIGNLWQDRREVVAGLINFHQFDVLGTQEGLPRQISDLDSLLPGYAHYGAGRDDGKNAGEHAAIFFKKDRFTLVDKGDFWLSETPGKPGLGWDATCCNRICSWVKLKERSSGKSFYVFNAHYDHQGLVARKESSKLILRKISEIAGKELVIFTGDLNGDHNSYWYKELVNSGQLFDTYQMAHKPYAYNSSFQNFGRNFKDEGIIDHVFTNRKVKVIRWGLLTDTYMGKYPSDHFPVLVELSY